MRCCWTALHSPTPHVLPVSFFVRFLPIIIRSLCVRAHAFLFTTLRLGAPQWHALTVGYGVVTLIGVSAVLSGSWAKAAQAVNAHTRKHSTNAGAERTATRQDDAVRLRYTCLLFYAVNAAHTKDRRICIAWHAETS